VETVIYVGTAVITVIWSVWIYLWWDDRAGLSEEIGLRLVLIVAPSSYFLLIAVSGWYNVPGLRLDLASLVLLDAATVVSGVFLAVLLALPGVDHKATYVIVLVLYNIVAVALVVAVYVVRHSPVLIIKLSSAAGQWSHIDFFSFSWIGGTAASKQPDVLSLLNKIFIALLSYIPVSAIRYASSVHQRRKMEREIVRLGAKIEALERRLDESDPTVVK
jgi:hypothetical protein